MGPETPKFGRSANEIRPSPKAAPRKGARVEIVNKKGFTGQKGTFQKVLSTGPHTGKWEVKLDDNRIARILPVYIREIPPHKAARVVIVKPNNKYCGKEGTFYKVLGQNTLSIDGKNHLLQDHWVVKLDGKRLSFPPTSIKVIPKKKSWPRRLWRWVCRRNDTPQSTVSPSLQKERPARVAAPRSR